MKTYKITYWSTTGLLSVMLIMSAGMYVFNNEAVQETFNVLGYPSYLVYPLVAAKLTAVAILLSQKGSIIKEWVYAALFFEFILAFFAHVMIGDGEQFGAVIAIALLLASYVSEKKLLKVKKSLS